MADLDSVADRPPRRVATPDPRPRQRPPVGSAPPPPGGRPGPDRRRPPGDGGPPGRRPPGPPEPVIDGQAAAKGITIVVITMVVGAFVFWQGLHRPVEEAADTGPVPTNEQRPAVVTTASLAPSTTPAPPPPSTRVSPAELAVVVGNAVDKDKPVAGTVAAKLNAAGYTTVRKMDVAKPLARSSVYYAAPEWRDDALAVAAALGIADTDVAALPNPPPLNAPKSKVFVIVGKEPRALSEPG